MSNLDPGRGSELQQIIEIAEELVVVSSFGIWVLSEAYFLVWRALTFSLCFQQTNFLRMA